MQATKSSVGGLTDNMTIAVGTVIENATSGGGDDTLHGNDFDNVLNGNGGVDTLNGYGGDDTLYGGDSGDTLNGGDANDLLDGGEGADIVNGGDGNDIVIESSVLSTLDIDTVNGEGGDDTLQVVGEGYGANFDGGADTDTLDLSAFTFASGYVVDLGAQTWREEPTTGVWTVANVENVIGSINQDSITGSGVSNVLNGGASSDTLDGAGGNDTLSGDAGDDIMLGGAGDDTYVVDVATDRVMETVSLADLTDAGGVDTVQSSVSLNLDAYAGIRFVEKLVLTGTGNINATGNALANSLTGNAGNNIIIGGLGADTMLGGAGNDVYVVDSSGDRVVETVSQADLTDAGGVDTVQSSVSLNLDAYAGIRFVEKLVLIGTGNINATGNALANSLTGNSGNNIIIGGLGADTMIGGAGNDVYVIDQTGDLVFETTTVGGTTDAGGNDIVQSAVTINLDGYAGVRFVETLMLTGSANINGSGNALGNRIFGNSGNNTLNGGAGSDTLQGGLGNDTLNGGAGVDFFQFASTLGAGNVDIIQGFSVVDDTIQLARSAFTGFAASGALAGTAFNTGTAASDDDDRIIFDTATGALIYDADGSGLGAAVQFATITGLVGTLGSGDFVII